MDRDAACIEPSVDSWTTSVDAATWVWEDSDCPPVVGNVALARHLGTLLVALAPLRSHESERSESQPASLPLIRWPRGPHRASEAAVLEHLAQDTLPSLDLHAWVRTPDAEEPRLRWLKLLGQLQLVVGEATPEGFQPWTDGQPPG